MHYLLNFGKDKPELTFEQILAKQVGPYADRIRALRLNVATRGSTQPLDEIMANAFEYGFSQDFGNVRWREMITPQEQEARRIGGRAAFQVRLAADMRRHDTKRRFAVAAGLVGTPVAVALRIAYPCAGTTLLMETAIGVTAGSLLAKPLLPKALKLIDEEIAELRFPERTGRARPASKPEYAA